MPRPNTAWLSDPEGSAKHSAAIDADIPADYQWIIGNPGKPWIASQNDEAGVDDRYLMSNGADPLYGWYYDEHTRSASAGIPIHNPETDGMVGDHWVIQRPWESGHKHHKDYSSTGVIARDDEPPEYWAIDGEGFVVLIRRLDADLEPPPDTEPSPPVARYLDPELTHGERVVAWYEHQTELGVHEQPNGSNNGPEISEWHRRTQRDGQPGFGAWLAKAGGNWCASSRSAAVDETRLPDDPPVQTKARASGLELETDAKADGTWRPAEMAITGAFRPEPGDGATMQRGQPGSWKRHVVTVVEDVPELAGCYTRGGNEGNRFGPRVFRRYSSLLGFLEMPDPTAPRYTGEIPDQGEHVIEMPELVVEGTPPQVVNNPLEDDGDNAIEKAWAGMTPSPWADTEWRGVTGKARRWRVLTDGIHVEGETGPRRTKGDPITVGRVWSLYRGHILEAHELTGVPLPTMLAMLATESGTNPRAERYEKHLDDWSFGAAQTLTSTAHAMARSLPIVAPARPYPRDHSTEQAWREFLFDPRHSILLGAAVIAYQSDHWGYLDDPVLAYAAYNSGHARPSDRPWGLHYFRGGQYDALDVFAAWYGDACAVLA